MVSHPCYGSRVSYPKVPRSSLRRRLPRASLITGITAQSLRCESLPDAVAATAALSLATTGSSFVPRVQRAWVHPLAHVQGRASPGVIRGAIGTGPTRVAVPLRQTAVPLS